VTGGEWEMSSEKHALPQSVLKRNEKMERYREDTENWRGVRLETML
jgi:hypothetical protein